MWKRNHNNNHLLTAKQISKRFKLAYPTINYYTDLGLLPIVKRNGNRRLYNGKQVRMRLGLIFKLMNEGYPLRLICKRVSAK